MTIVRERWPFARPFRITGHTFTELDLVVVALEQDGRRGRGEAAGVYYLGDDAEHVVAQLEDVRADIEAGMSRVALRTRLPRGGARNALDCALWDLEAALSGKPVWALAGMAPPRPLTTTFTIGAGEPEEMAATARRYSEALAIKLKLVGDDRDAARVHAVWRARPDVWLGVDANQGLVRASFDRLMPTLVECGVKLIEQPFAIGREAEFDGIQSTIELAADESVQDSADIAAMQGRVSVINIKLDKCGGLTEGLLMVEACKRAKLKIMVGNMVGTSLSTGPAYLLGQHCDVVDLDGPIHLAYDRAPEASYAAGKVTCPAEAWGSGEAC
jgi:L-alanine-DL-glutamate epimerase-like enolase superfamily enzyme